MVSIIMPSYNCEPFLNTAINSLLVQTYQNWELLFQDDCSTDNTKEIITKYAITDPRIKYECNRQNSGAAVTRNNALRRAQGRWIAFLDSDDMWEPEKLEKQIQFMERNGYHFSYTGYSEIDAQANDIGKYIYGPRHITKFRMYAFCWPGCLTVMYDKDYVGLIQIEDIKKNNDYAMWLKVIKKTDCFLLDECLAKYRRGRIGSVSTHSYVTLIHWHYKLFRIAEGMKPISSLIITFINLICGVYKKFKYVKTIRL